MFFGIALLSAVASATPVVTLHSNTNNVAGAPWRASADNSNTKYLGLFNTTAECEWACLSGPPPAGAYCCSFTYHTPQYEATQPHGWNRQCFGVINGHWVPDIQANITSGQVEWPTGSPAARACAVSTPTPAPTIPPPPSGPCSTALDCGLNGVCRSGKCVCRPAWTGDRCQTLALLPANLSAGYRHVTESGQNISSWGGSVIWSSEDKLWHMFAAEMLNSCGLTAWACNSQVVHATSPSLAQRFVRSEPLIFLGGSGGSGSSGSTGSTGNGVHGVSTPANPVQPRFAHEPTVVRGPAGEWVMYWTGCDPAAPAGSPSSCSPTFSAGHTAPANCTGLGDGSTPPTADVVRKRSNDHTWMAWAPTANGPWAQPVVVLKGSGIDSNLSPVILQDGSLVGLWRGGLNSTRPWSTIQRVAASDWKDPASYRPEYNDLFPDVHSTEDPHV
jgi:hypothetical protein